jgi:hypothetical protein
MRPAKSLVAVIAVVAPAVLAAFTACSSANPPHETGTDGVDAAADTWRSYAQTFFATYCVECHDASNATGRDFTRYTVVFQNAAEIRCGVAPAQDPAWSCSSSLPVKQFPIDDATHSNPKPSDAERARLAAWINSGAPE